MCLHMCTEVVYLYLLSVLVDFECIIALCSVKKLRDWVEAIAPKEAQAKQQPAMSSKSHHWQIKVKDPPEFLPVLDRVMLSNNILEVMHIQSNE